MNRFLWNLCKKTNLKRNNDRYLFLVLVSLFYGFVGFILWIIARNFIPVFNDMGWIICLIGYPMAFAYIGGLFYLFKHE